jgi:hypothetical protein
LRLVLVDLIGEKSGRFGKIIFYRQGILIVNCYLDNETWGLDLLETEMDVSIFMQEFNT